MYNLKDDPFELHDLSEDAPFTGIRAEMLAELAAAMMRAADPLPPPHHRYRIKRHPDGYWRDKDFTAADPGITKI